MPDRATFLDIIDGAYACRMKGDKAGVAAFVAPGATFRIPGDRSLMPNVEAGGGAAMPTIGHLIDDFTFHDVERLDAIVDGDKAAVLWKLTVSYRGGEPVTTEVCDIWTVDADGKMTSLLQFVDTSLVAKLTNS
jgi:ketosteroid isomerase-like protein